jgi:hypothetical protein
MSVGVLSLLVDYVLLKTAKASQLRQSASNLHTESETGVLRDAANSKAIRQSCALGEGCFGNAISSGTEYFEVPPSAASVNDNRTQTRCFQEHV